MSDRIGEFGGLTDLPRWTQTCDNGHEHRVRAEQRPVCCPTCGVAFQVYDNSLMPRKRASGDAALATEGDGWGRLSRRLRA